MCSKSPKGERDAHERNRGPHVEFKAGVLHVGRECSSRRNAHGSGGFDRHESIGGAGSAAVHRTSLYDVSELFVRVDVAFEFKLSGLLVDGSVIAQLQQSRNERLLTNGLDE